MIIKKLKKTLLLASCVAVMSVGSVTAFANELEEAGDNIISDEAELIDETDTSVGVHDGKVMLNEKNFPDAYFREKLSRLADENDYITISEVTDLGYRNNSDIRSLKGIEFFSELRTLEIPGCINVNQLDVSKNTQLVRLVISNTGISQIDISNNKKMVNFQCDNTDISELNLRNNIGIYWLICNNTKIKDLDLKYNTKLMYLYCNNTDIVELDLSANTELFRLVCNNSNLKKLDINNNTKLWDIDCSNTSLECLDLSNNIELHSLNCSNTLIDELDVSKSEYLLNLDCSKTNVHNIDLSQNLRLASINVLDTNIDKLDFSNNNQIMAVMMNNSIKQLILPENMIKSGYVQGDLGIHIVNADTLVELSKISGIDLNLVDDEAFDNETKILDLNKIDFIDKDSVGFEFVGSVSQYKKYHKVEGYYLWKPEQLGFNMYFYNIDNNVKSVDVTYHTHIQTYGDTQGTKSNGEMAGTSGEAKRLENIWIDIDGNDNLGIQYSTHCQTYGWLSWSCDGETNGTSGEAKRLEAIKIQLTGADKDAYDVYYRVHAQSYGWLGWAKNGEPSGTAGYGKRLEGIQIVVVKKGEAAPGLKYAGVDGSSSKYSSKPYVAKTNETIVIPGDANAPIVSYKTHVQTFGWQKWVTNGQMSGTSGKSKRLEGIKIKVTNCPYDGDIVYTTHVQKYGWKDGKPNADKSTWKKNGQMSGTNGEAKRLEAICIDLTGEMAEHYDVYYRVHAQTFGWLGWAKNGEESGTAGYAKRLEGIQIVLVPKGGAAPANDYGGITSKDARAFISK